MPLENVDYSTAVQVLRDSGHTVQLVLKRRVVLPPNNANSNPNVATPAEQSPQTLRVSLARGKKKDDFGLVLGCRLYVKEVGSRSREAGLREGDALVSINALPTDNMTLKEAKKLMDSTKERLNLVVSYIDLVQLILIIKFWAWDLAKMAMALIFCDSQ